jgi:hypothetical protein
MISSKDPKDLRPDVYANWLVFVERMVAKGRKVALACVLRDQEKQTQLHNTIGAPALVSFHWGGGKGKGLAFDIYQDAPTYEKQWKDAGFWKTAREILTELGFSPVPGEESHSQWDDGRKFTSTMVRAGKLPPPMPLYKPEPITPPPAALKLGYKGKDVVNLQERLNKLGFPCGSADGDFGKRTLEAVKAFQAAKGLVVDGIVGKVTWKELFA